ncbi:hypothetical protein [Nocardioides humi]|nr:hypothetical protein [Nocardioides humi]
MRANGIDALVGVEIVSARMRAWSPEQFARCAFEAAAPYWAR